MSESRWFLRQVADRIALECDYEAVSDPTIRRAIARCDLDTPELRRAASPAIYRRGKRRHRNDEEKRRGKFPTPPRDRQEPRECCGPQVRRQQGVLHRRRARWRDAFGRPRWPPRLLPGGRAGGGAREERGGHHVGTAHPTVTPDRGRKFADWARVAEAIGAEFYFCSPHHPWEKGTVENTGGLIDKGALPRGHRLRPHRRRAGVERACDGINRRPCKRLGWRMLWKVQLTGVALALKIQVVLAIP